MFLATLITRILVVKSHEMSLLQVNRVRNSSNRSLDLIFVLDSIDSVVHRIDPLTLPENPFHPTLDMVIDILLESADRLLYFRMVDFHELNYLILQVD